MVNWQVTAKTIYCQAVGDEVTLLVYKDGSAKCTGRKKYGGNNRSAKVKNTSGRLVRCDAGCPQLIEYKDKLFAEEAGKNANRAEER